MFTDPDDPENWDSYITSTGYPRAKDIVSMNGELYYNEGTVYQKQKRNNKPIVMQKLKKMTDLHRKLKHQKLAYSYGLPLNYFDSPKYKKTSLGPEQCLQFPQDFTFIQRVHQTFELYYEPEGLNLTEEEVVQ